MLINLEGDSDRRARAIAALRDPDASRDEVLQKFVRLASQALGIPGSFISVLDDHHQYIQAAHNFSLKHSPRELSLCRHVVDSDNIVVVNDTLLDARFSSHPLIIGAPFIRFYVGVPLKNAEGIVLGTLCVTDTSAHPFSNEQRDMLKRLAALVMSFLQAWHSAGFIDALTGLPNRQRLIRDVQLLAASEQPLTRRLVIIDCVSLPRAIELARSMGIAAVENLLKDVATLLPLRLRACAGEVFYTLTTGRFAVLTRADTLLNAGWVTDKLAGISADIGEGMQVALSTHAGEITFIPGKIAAQDALRFAINTLHEAVSRDVPSLRFTDIEETQRTFDGTRFTGTRGMSLVYQPRICLRSGRPVGLDALIRWQDPARGEHAAGFFMPLTEQTERQHALTPWLVDEVMTRLKRLRNTCIQLPITLTLSSAVFAQAGFAEALAEKMHRSKIPTALLGIACSEPERLIESDEALDGLEALKRHGFTVSLDDVDTAQSTVYNLHRMPSDAIKLDRTLFNDMSMDTAARIIASDIFSLLKERDYTLLSEGTEEIETAETNTPFNDDRVKASFHARPLPERELDEWLSWKLRGQC